MVLHGSGDTNRRFLDSASGWDIHEPLLR